MTLRQLDWELQLKQEEEEVLALEEEFKKQRSELQLKKTRLDEKKRNDWEWQQQKLATRLKELETAIDANDQFRNDAFLRVADMRFKALEVQQNQLKLEDQLKEAARLAQVEELVRKKLELERLRERRQDLNIRENRQTTQLQAIQLEKDRRDTASLANLHRILHKAEHLDAALKRGDLDRQNQILLSHALSEGGEQNEKQRKRMVDEIKAKRERDREMQILEKERRIQALNENRYKLIQREQEVLREGALHARLVEKGVDYLADVETGKAQKFSEGYLDIHERDEPIEEVIEAARAGLPKLSERIRGLKSDKETTVRIINYIQRPYEDNQMRSWRKTVQASTFVAMKDLVYDIVDEVWDKIMARKNEISTIMEHKDYYEKKNLVAQRKLKQQVDLQALVIVAQTLIREAADDMLNNVAAEVFGIAAYSNDLILDFAAIAISIQRNANEGEVRRLLDEVLEAPTGLPLHFQALSR